MANEGKKFYKQEEQEELLTNFYNAILKGNLESSAQEQKKFLLQLLNTKISQLEPKTGRIKKINYVLHILIMLFSGVTTVLLGLKLDGNVDLTREFNNAALIVSASMTFLSGLAVFWDIENYWIRNKIMLNKLKEIRYEYVFYLSGSPDTTSAELRPFLERFLVSLGDEYWEKFLKDVRKEAAPPTTTAQ